MIFLKQSEEDTYTPLHVVIMTHVSFFKPHHNSSSYLFQIPPTVPGLKEAIKSMCTLPFELRQILRRNKHGAIVKFDDEMIQFYSHANTFTMEARHISTLIASSSCYMNETSLFFTFSALKSD
jgi:hypothetical protein